MYVGAGVFAITLVDGLPGAPPTRDVLNVDAGSRLLRRSTDAQIKVTTLHSAFGVFQPKGARPVQEKRSDRADPPNCVEPLSSR